MKSESVFLSIVLVCFLGFMLHSAPSAAQGEIKIGALIPLTGFVSGFGQQQQIAIQQAAEEINKSGGILGKKLNIVVYDEESKGEKSILGFRKLVTQDQVLAVIGPFLSTSCEVTFPLANRHKTVSISASAGKAGLAENNRPFAFVNFTTDQETMPSAIKHWQKQHNIKTVAIVTDIKDALNKATGTIVMPKLLADTGITVIGTSEFVTGEMDFSAHVSKFKGLNPDGIVISCTIADAAGFVKESRKQGLKTPFIGGVAIQATKFLELAGPDANGTVTGASFYVDSADAMVRNFVKEYRKRYGDRDPIPQAAAMYETVYMLKHVIEKTGVTNKSSELEADREKIQKSLAGLKDFKGVTGTLTMNTGGTITKGAYVLVAKDGKWVLP